MPVTFVALAVAVLAILPGAAYTFAFESKVGAFQLSAPDRLIRFLAASAVFHALASGITYDLYRRFILSGQLTEGKINAFTVEIIAIVYVFLPFLFGWLIGTVKRRNWPIIRKFGNGNYHPRAWDFLFSQQLKGIFRIRLKSGNWIAGVFSTHNGRRSYASSHGEDGDLYMIETVLVDPDTGAFQTDESDEPIVEAGGILVRWSDVEYAQYFQMRGSDVQERR